MSAVPSHGFAALATLAMTAWLLLACGCPSAQQLRSDLQGALDGENRGSRLDDDSLREIRIEGYRVVDLEFSDDARHARADVEMTWRYVSEATLHMSKIHQRWRIQRGRWDLHEEWQIGGEVMPSMLQEQPVE